MLDIQENISFKTYAWDVPLFRDLGFEPFAIPMNEEHFVGKWDENNIKIEVFVTCSPAHNWRIEIETISKKRVTLQANSTPLYEVWNTATLIASETLFISDRPGKLSKELIN